MVGHIEILIFIVLGYASVGLHMSLLGPSQAPCPPLRRYIPPLRGTTAELGLLKNAPLQARRTAGLHIVARLAFSTWRITLTACYLARSKQKMLAQEIYRDADQATLSTNSAISPC